LRSGGPDHVERLLIEHVETACMCEGDFGDLAIDTDLHTDLSNPLPLAHLSHAWIGALVLLHGLVQLLAI